MANNPYVNKVVKEGTTLIDLSADTALAADVAQGKYFHLATGERVAGTASAGGGAVIQDQDGFLVLSDQGGGGGGGGGLEYEMDTWSPTSDVAQPTINFANQHTERPIFVLLSDVTDTIADTDSSLAWSISSWYDAFSSSIYASSSTLRYGRVQYEYKTSSSSSSSGTQITYLTGDSNNCMPWHLTNEHFRPYCGSDSRYWRANRNYKWIAVWAPTS